MNIAYYTLYIFVSWNKYSYNFFKIYCINLSNVKIESCILKYETSTYESNKTNKANQSNQANN